MHAERPYKRICAEYKRLLMLCQKSLESWRSQREEFIRFGLRGKKVADELLRLQADYARAYYSHAAVVARSQLRGLPLRLENRWAQLCERVGFDKQHPA